MENVLRSPLSLLETDQAQMILVFATENSFSSKNLVFKEAATRGVLCKKVFLEISRIHRKTPVPKSLF